MTVIRLKKPWKIWPIGHVIAEMPPGQASQLIARGLGEEVKEESRLAKVLSAPVNRMMPSPVRKK